MIHIRAIIEILGAPEEHVAKSIEEYIRTLKEKYNIISVAIEKPIKQNLMWSSFAELEAKFNSVEELFNFCLQAMPSSIEILEPKAIEISARELTNFTNDLQARLHATDMIVKTLRAEKTIIDKNAITILNNFIAALLRTGGKSLVELSAQIGIKPNELEPFINKLIERKKIIKSEDKYELIV